MRRVRTLPLALAAIGVGVLVGCTPTAPAASSDPAAPTGTPAPSGSSAPAGASASPTPAPTASASATPSDDDGSAAAITDPAVLNAWDPVRVSTAPVAVWGDGFRTVQVFAAGSSSPDCQPIGDDVEIEGDRLDIGFEQPDGDADCPADLAVFGWEFTLPTEGSAAIMTARIDGLTADGELTVDIQPAG